MASSFIDFDGKGFWIRDNIFNLALRFLYARMSECNLPAWAIEFGNLIRENAAGEFYGFVDLELDRFLVNTQRKQFFLRLLSEVTEVLNNGTSDLHNTELYRRMTDSLGLTDIDIEVSRVTKVLSCLGKLVKGEITTTASDPIEYFF